MRFILFVIMLATVSSSIASEDIVDHVDNETGWSHAIKGGKILSHITVSGNVLTLTMKTFKRDKELYNGLAQAFTELDLFSEPRKIHEFDPDHQYLLHPTHSRNHIHFPLHRDVFPFMTGWLSICVSKFLNSFSLDNYMVKVIIKNVEPELSTDEVNAIVENFRNWESKSQASRRIYSSVLTSRDIEAGLWKRLNAAVLTFAGAMLTFAFK